MAKTSVAILIADLGSGGAQKIALSLVEPFLARGYKVSLITLATPENDFFTAPESCQRIALGEIQSSRNAFEALRANLRRILKLRSAIKASGAEVVISFIAPMNILTLLATRLRRVKVIISERNDPARQSFGRLWDTLRRLLYRYADCVTANSETAIRHLENYVKPSKLVYIPNHVHLPERSPGKEPSRTILAVGRLHHQKGFDTLIHAFATISNAHPDWRLVIAGEGPLRPQLESQIQALGLTGRVRLAGQVKNLEDYYREAAFLVLPSRHEGTPNVVLEALSYNLPVIASDQSAGALAFVKHEENGLVFPTDRIEDLAACLERLISEPELLTKFREKARPAVEHLGINAISSQWVKVIEEL